MATPINQDVYTFFKNQVELTDDEVKDAWEAILQKYKGSLFDERGKPLNKNLRITALDVNVPQQLNHAQDIPNSPNHDMTKLDLNHRIYKIYKKETSFLNYLIMHRHPRVVRYFLRQPFQYPYCSQCYQNTAMHAAVLRADEHCLDIIKLMVKRFGADETLLFQRNAMSLTPLELAVILNKKDVFDYLLDQQLHYYEKKYVDYHPERMASAHMTKINFVVEHGRVAMFQQLVKHFGRHTVCQAIIGKTILKAIQDNKHDMVNYLIRILPADIKHLFLLQYQIQMPLPLIHAFDEHHVIKMRHQQNEAYQATIYNTKLMIHQQLDIDPICQTTAGHIPQFSQDMQRVMQQSIQHQHNEAIQAFIHYNNK